jgi:hypothetical protein
MKGTNCGRRALVATLVLGCAVAIAPALAQAGLGAGDITSAVPSIPSVPAVPAVPSVPAAPAVPSVQAPATPTVTSSVGSPAVSVTAGNVKVQVKTQGTPAVRQATSKAAPVTKVSQKAGAVATGTVASKASQVSKLTGKKTWTVRIHQANGRVLTTRGDDPELGCKTSTYTLCFQYTEFFAINQCNSPDPEAPALGEPVPLKGHGALWIILPHPVGAAVVSGSRFFFQGVSDLNSPLLPVRPNQYAGKDVQSDSEVVMASGFYADLFHYQELVVTKRNPNPLYPPVSMYLYFHVRIGPGTLDIPQPMIVCKKGDRPDKDRDMGDHSQECRRHSNTGDNTGYNDDPNEWKDD